MGLADTTSAGGTAESHSTAAEAGGTGESWSATRSIVVVGSINMDLVATCPSLPRPGETVSGTSFATIPGGKGSNQAIAAARAGRYDDRAHTDVTMVGAIGSDPFGATLVHALAAAGVTVGGIRHVDGPSGIAQISVDASAENCIIVMPGANAAITDLTEAERGRIAAADLVILQLEIPDAGVVSAAHTAAAAGVPVMLNPSPVRELSTELLRAVTVLVVNEGEAATLGFETLSAVPHLVTTLGAHGASYRGPDGREIAVAAPQVEAIDTTGAGDAFTGALAVAWVEGLAPEDAVRRACAAGALAATVAGASTSSPTRAAIDALAAATYR